MAPIKLNTWTATTATPSQTFQPGAAFSDQQKQELAKSVGFSGEYDPNMFNKQFDPSTGQEKLYIKVGGNKLFGPQPVSKGTGVQEQAQYMQQNFAPKTLDDAYSAILKARPSDTEIQVQIGKDTGLSDQIAGVRAQAEDIQRKMLADQSAIFSATNPDGSPIDPRVKVAQFQSQMQSYSDRLDQLAKLESTYKGELGTLSQAESDRIKQETERNKTALQYLQDINQRKMQDQTFDLQKQQFELQKQGQAFNQNKPEWAQDSQTGQWINKNSTVVPGTSLQDLTATLARNTNGTVNNVGQDTNNPGNIMADTQGQRDIALKLGATGFYKSPNWRTYAVFPSMQSGFEAMQSDLKTKLSGGSSWVTPNTTLGQLASGWVSGPNAPTNQNAVANYVKLTGYPAGTKVSDIPLEVLSRAIVQNEGVDITRDANVPSEAGQYVPQSDPQLTQVGSGAQGGIFQDARTGNTITGEQAKQLYGQPKATEQGAGKFSESETTQFRTYNGNSIPEEYKTKAQKEQFLKRFGEWQAGGNFTKDQRKDISDVFGTLKSLDTFKQYEELRAKSNTLYKISNALEQGNATPQDKQQLINDFAKILDPTSVVRESEYALAGKYSQSQIEAKIQEIKNFFTASGPLSNDASKMLAQGLRKRFDAIAEQYDNTIDTQLQGLSIRSGIEVPVEALGVQYSPLRTGSGQSPQGTQQKMSTAPAGFQGTMDTRLNARSAR